MTNLKTAKGEYEFAYTNIHGIDMYKINEGFVSANYLLERDGEPVMEEKKTKKSKKKQEIIIFDDNQESIDIELPQDGAEV